MSKRKKTYRRSKRWIKRELIREHGSVCAICTHPIMRMKDITLDHILPRSKGGDDELENLQLAHEACNRLKDDMTADQFSLWLQEAA